MKTLEEEVLKIKNQVNGKRSIIIDRGKIEQKENEILSFNESFFYGPAEKAVGYNSDGILDALKGDISAAIEKFKIALQHFEHETIAANLAKCYKKQSQYTAQNELSTQFRIEEIVEHSSSSTTDSFLNLEYLNIDKKNDDSDYSHLLGYNFVYEKKNKDNQNSINSYLIFNVPYVIWKEFYTVFIALLQRENYEHDLNRYIEDSDLFLFEINNKPYIHEQMDREYIPFYTIAELKILEEDKDNVLNLYQHFIIQYYLKSYNRAYMYEEMNNTDPGINDYMQSQGEAEVAYGYLKSAIFNLKNNYTDPFLTLNIVEYQKGISEYRSFFPHVFSNEAIALGFIESTFEKKLLEKVKNVALKENLMKEYEGALSAIKYHPSSIYLHVRKSMEIIFKYIFEQFKQNTQLGENQNNLHGIIKEVIKHMENKKYLYQPVLDIMNAEQQEYMLSKQKFKEYVHNIKNDSNKNIHFAIDEESSNLKIDSQEALELFMKNVAIINILVDEFEL